MTYLYGEQGNEGNMPLCILNMNKVMFKQLRKAISIFILITFISSSLKSTTYAQVEQSQMALLPAPGVMVHLSPDFTPALLKGIVIHPENALKFDFIIYKGDQALSEQTKKIEYTKLIKYFLASLAVPDDDQWVNLSPYEMSRIIKEDFGKTEMGRDLLAQDYMLKQVTASLIYPQDKLGQEFWDKVYAKAYKQFRTTNIPVNTFNKVWIVPDDAEVLEKGNMAYVVKNHLKVMLEEDYLSLQKHLNNYSLPLTGRVREGGNKLGSQIVREVVLPALEKEVNEGKNFALLRQVFSGVVLAAWYKKELKESFLGQVYINKSRLKGVDQDPKNNQIIYHQYLKAFKKGVFNFIKEDIDRYSNETIPRKYFSGGAQVMTPLTREGALHVIKNPSPAQFATAVADFDKAEIVTEVDQEIAPQAKSLDLAMTDDIPHFEEYDPSTDGEFSSARYYFDFDIGKSNPLYFEYGTMHWKNKECCAFQFSYQLPPKPLSIGASLGQFLMNVFREPQIRVGPVRSVIFLFKDYNRITMLKVGYLMHNANLSFEQKKYLSDWADGKRWDRQPFIDLLNGLLKKAPLSGIQSPQMINDLMAHHKPQKSKFTKKPVMGYRITSPRIEDIPEAIRQNLNAAGRRKYIENYLRDNIGSVILLQMQDDNPDFFVLPKTSLENYKEVSLKQVQAGNSDLISHLTRLNVMQISGLVGMASTEVVEMVQMSDIGYSIEDEVIIKNPFGDQTKPKGKNAFLRWTTSLDQYTMVNSENGRDPINWIHAKASTKPDKAALSKYGGIDFNSANFNLKIKRNDYGAPLPLAQQDMAQLNNLEGFEPVIIQIRPAFNAPLLNKLQQESSAV